MTDKHEYSFVILPHWRIEGGAGYYIRDLIAALRLIGIVNVAGPYAGDYSEAPIISPQLDKLTLQTLPTYMGIRLAATLYNLSISALSAIPLLLTPRYKRVRLSFHALILTSSVQAIAVPIARRLFPESRIAIVVQENVCLSRGLGRLTKFFLKRADVVVSITEAWAQHARQNGLEPVNLPNSYDPDYAAPEHNREPAIESDLLYVGGDATIKGFDNLIAALPTLLQVPGRRIICLGRYGEQARRRLELIRDKARPGALLDIVGLASDVRPYLRGTKLLILPIGSPHFCRPAIEAGLLGKTFVIPHFPELDDFASDGENCATYKPASAEDLVLKVTHLLNNPLLVERLSRGNGAVAARFIDRSQFFEKLVESLGVQVPQSRATKL